jgi:pyridoxamine 5'-phosphate oxidase
MIQFNNLKQEDPYLKLKQKYNEAINKNQKFIEAITISSFSKHRNEVNSRYVNLKFINNKEFIFFSNYNSPKANEFIEHDQITALFFWNSINVQIRMKAKIKKTPSEFNQNYFFDRLKEKNALAISSNQSKEINSYNQVKDNYNKSLKNDDLKTCPEFWGGYSFIPYYFEFWEGHKSRLNKREVYEKNDCIWEHFILQP